MSLSLEVKTVSLDNLADLRALDQDSFPEPWSRSLWKLELSRPNRIYLGAFKGAELIGFIGGLLAHTDFHITTVATKKSHRCSGVGSFLLLRMLKKLMRFVMVLKPLLSRCVLLINRLRVFIESLVLLQWVFVEVIIKLITRMQSS